MVDVRKRIAARGERFSRGKRVERVSMVVGGRPELGTSSFLRVLEGRNAVVEDGCRRSFAFSPCGLLCPPRSRCRSLCSSSISDAKHYEVW